MRIRNLAIQAALLILVSQAPCYAQFTRNLMPDTLSLFTTISTGTTLAFFMIFVVYTGGAFAVLVASRYKAMGVINLAIACLAFLLMIVEPSVIDILAASGFQYTVKITTQLALVSICGILACSLTFLPVILAFAKNTRMKLWIVLLNILGLIVFPLFILALYLVQNQIGEKSFKEREAEKKEDEKPEEEESFWADSDEFSDDDSSKVEDENAGEEDSAEESLTEDPEKASLNPEKPNEEDSSEVT